MLSAGSKITFQGGYTHGAIAYSGATSPAWAKQDDGFNTNDNGTFALSTAWSQAAQLAWKVSPNFEIDPEIS